MRALIIVDVQNDFCEGGALAVAGGAAVATAVSQTVRSSAGRYDHVVATRDYHIDPGDHFVVWPPHCRAGTFGASFHPELDVAGVEAVFSKGQYSHGYSGFEGVEPGGAALADWLSSHGVTEVELVGVATDHCVRATALDAVAGGFVATVLTELTAGVAPESSTAALEELRAAGVTVT